MYGAFDQLIPDSVRREGPDAARRARALVLGAAVAASVCGWISWMQIRYGEPRVGLATLVFGLLCLAIPPFVRATGRWRAPAAGFCIGVFLVAGAVTGASGGTLVSAAFYLCIVPMLGTLLLGARFGAVTALAGVVLLSTVEYLRRDGFTFPLQPPAETLAQSAFRGALIFQLVLFVVAAAYDYLRTSSLRDLAESGARLRALGKDHRELLLELDTGGRVRFVSREPCLALGWDPEALIDSVFLERVHPVNRPQLREALGVAIANGGTWGDPIRLRAGDGEWRWFEPHISSYDVPLGRRRLIVVARDLTERLRMEEQARQSQKLDAVGQLAGGVAHDFNNLLMVISGYAEELLEAQTEGSEEHEAAVEILHAAEQGDALARQLLAVSRPQATDLQDLVLNDVVRGIERMLRRMVGEDIVLELDLAEDLPNVLADPGHLEQILVNLAVNARDAMPSGGSLQIRSDHEGDRVLLEVMDSGIGMDHETRERIFEAFFTTKERGHGTGLGLAVVYSLVRGMEGEIHVDSAPGQGTRVVIDFAASDGEKAPTPVQPERAPLLRGRETVLVVEDRDAVRRLVRQTLERAGYTVLAAASGAEALELAATHPAVIDLALSDVVMPHMSGPELVRALRQARPELRVLFMSGHPERSRELEQELAAGTLIHKPVLPSDLCRHVRQAIDGP